MLITKEQMLAAMDLDRDQVVAALLAGGYESDDIYTATFEGVTDAGEFVYTVTFPDSEGVGSGPVFLHYAPNDAETAFVLFGAF